MHSDADSFLGDMDVHEEVSALHHQVQTQAQKIESLERQVEELQEALNKQCKENKDGRHDCKRLGKAVIEVRLRTFLFNAHLS